jgi:hypothetical protein
MHHKREENKLEWEVRELETQCVRAEELESQTGWKCRFVRLRSGEVEFSVLMRCDVEALSDWCPTFRDSAMVSWVGMHMQCVGDFTTLEYWEDHAASKCPGSLTRWQDATCRKNGDLKMEMRWLRVPFLSFLPQNEEGLKLVKQLLQQCF